ncbi:MAG: metallophosphoesterase [Sedimentisphaerales bacterium]
MKFNRLAVCLTIVLLMFAAAARAEAWKFGVMGDTQWTCPNDPGGKNPESVPKSIIDQVNKQFIEAGVKFVIQVGDLSNSGTDPAEKVRAEAAQPLYDANIGFFPMRGNHEVSSAKPNGYSVAIFKSVYPQTRGLSQTFGAANFSSPTSVSEDLNGMSYSFDYGDPCNNARFVIIDNWATPSKDINAAGLKYGYSFGEQQAWISSRLDKNTRGTEHAFVFSHQPLIAESHQDAPFIGYTNANQEMQNAFFACLQNNGVKYYICGHDHLHQRSIITSPDGQSSVEEIICASCSSKFYTPKDPNDSKWYGQKAREKSISREIKHVGYYIFTIDGPRVAVDYYDDNDGDWQSDVNYPNGPNDVNNQITPDFHFVKKETWGYNLSGK